MKTTSMKMVVRRCINGICFSEFMILFLLCWLLQFARAEDKQCASNDEECDNNNVARAREKNRSAAVRILSAYISSEPELLLVEQDIDPEGVERRAEFLDQVIDDARRFVGHDTFSDSELNDILLEATRTAAAKARSVVSRKHSIDRNLHGLLRTIEDSDCMEREFDMNDPEYNSHDAIEVLSKCKLLVLRNVFDEGFLMEYRKNFTNYIDAMYTNKISSTGKTSNGEPYYQHEIDHKRWEVILPKEFAHPDLLANSNVLNILMNNQILGQQLTLHSLGTALAEPGANGQQWHKDADYLFSETSLATHGIGGHDLPAYSITMMVPLIPNMTHAHGPTEFCMGSSWVDGVPDIESASIEDFSLLEKIGDWIDLYEKGHRACPPRFWRMPLLNFGDMLLFDYQINHRGGQNVSPDLRGIMYMTYSRQWYKDQNFNGRRVDEIEEKMDMLNELQRDAEREPFSAETERRLNRLRQNAILEQLTSFARFAEPSDHTCEGETGSIEDCWSGPASASLECLTTGKDKAHVARVIAKFIVSNIDVNIEGGVQIVLVDKKIEKLGVLGAGEYMQVEAKSGSKIEGRIKGGRVLRAWTILPEQTQLVFSSKNIF